MASHGDLLANTYDLDLERELLGAAFVSQACAQAVAQADETLCYGGAHRRIHDAIRRLVQRGCIPTPALVVDEIHPDEDQRETYAAGVFACMDSIAVAVPSTVRHIGEQLQRYATRRHIRDAAMQMLSDITTSEEPLDILARGVQQLLSHLTHQTGTTLRSIGDIASSIYDGLDQPFHGLSWGFPRMDAIFGMNGQDWLTFLGGRPSSGKTALALNMAYNVARSGRPTLFASLEMSDEQAGTRILSGVARVSQKNIREKNLGEINDAIEKIAAACNEMQDVPMYIAAPRATIADLRMAVLQVQAQTGQRLGGLYIDRIELLGDVKYSKDDRRIATSIAATLLQDLAKEMQIPVICLAQLSRKMEDAGRAKPRKSDFQETGTIEQVAAVLMAFENEEFEDGMLDQFRKLHVVKNMHGQTGWVPLKFRPYAVTFEEVSDAEYTSIRAARTKG